MLGLLGAALLCGGAWLATTRTERRLRRAPHYRIGELPEGTPGRLIGQVQALGAALISPFSRRPCVYYIAKIEEADVPLRGVVCEEQRSVPFLLVDSSGRALVDPSGARLAIDFVETVTSTPTATERAFLDRHGMKDFFSGVNKKLLFREAVIAVDETIAVLGSGVREPDPESAPSAGYRDELPTRLRLTSSSRFPLVISDRPNHHGSQLNREPARSSNEGARIATAAPVRRWVRQGAAGR